jgi:hypothetical protein
MFLLLEEKMVLSREEKERMVLELYYNKGYTYRQITKELRMSPNQIREIIKRHEEKNEAIANKKKVLSLSSQAFKLFSEGKSNVQVTIKLDIPPEHVTQLRLQYWRLQNQDDLESLYMSVKGKGSVLWKIYKELMIIWGMTIEEVASALNVSLPLHLARLYRELAKRGMSIEEIAAVVDIDLNKLPYMKQMLEETTKAVARKQLELDILETRISSLKEEENRRRNRIFTPSFLLSLC